MARQKKSDRSKKRHRWLGKMHNMVRKISDGKKIATDGWENTNGWENRHG